MKRFFIKSFFIVLIIAIILGVSFPQKQVITGKDQGIQEIVQVHIYFWFLATFRVIEKNISEKTIYIDNHPSAIELETNGDSIFIPGGARDLPGIFTTLQPNEPRISRLYFKILLHTKYALSKQIDWGYDSTSIQPFVLHGVLLKE